MGIRLLRYFVLLMSENFKNIHPYMYSIAVKTAKGFFNTLDNNKAITLASVTL